MKIQQYGIQFVFTTIICEILTLATPARKTKRMVRSNTLTNQTDSYLGDESKKLVMEMPNAWESSSPGMHLLASLCSFFFGFFFVCFVSFCFCQVHDLNVLMQQMKQDY